MFHIMLALARNVHTYFWAAEKELTKTTADAIKWCSAFVSRVGPGYLRQAPNDESWKQLTTAQAKLYLGDDTVREPNDTFL